jgi:hypothetical protein
LRRPERKGRKPFVPPSGRNAGKPLGGDLFGRRRLEREGYVPERRSLTPGPSGDLPTHPLGRDVLPED